MHDFSLVNADTDSITICKKDGSPFSEDEKREFFKELNSLFPETIKWEDDGYFSKVVVLKAKNYILFDGNKIKLKGSAIKASTKSPALKEFIKKIIDCLIYNENIENDKLKEIYLNYVKEIDDIQDIKRWAARKTISEKTLNSERTNEARLRDAIVGTEIVEGDRCYVYFDNNNDLKLVQDFNGDYHKDRLFKNLFDTIKIFDTVIDCSIFPNFALKKNKKLLQEELVKDKDFREFAKVLSMIT